MMSVHARSSLQILDAGAGILGVGEQRKMTNVFRASTYTIQGAFGEPMTPTVQGFLGPDKLPAVLVPGMKDNIYEGQQPKCTQAHQKTGTIVLESDSCQELLSQAIHQGS